VLQTGANAHESPLLEPLLDAVPWIRTPRGGRRKRPDKLHADKAYAGRPNRQRLRRRHIKARIARKGIESTERLGRHRWKVERTFSWLNRFRRLRVRYERREDTHQALLLLACSLIALRRREGRF
jgi:transposase